MIKIYRIHNKFYSFPGGLPVMAGEFGWTDTTKLGRVADACEAILAELKGLRVDLRNK